MVDAYGMLLKMIAEGNTIAEISSATGWPTDAVETLRDELEVDKSSESWDNLSIALGEE